MPFQRRICSTLLVAAALLAGCRTVPEKARVVTPPAQPEAQRPAAQAPAAAPPTAPAPQAAPPAAEAEAAPPVTAPEETPEQAPEEAPPAEPPPLAEPVPVEPTPEPGAPPAEPPAEPPPGEPAPTEPPPAEPPAAQPAPAPSAPGVPAGAQPPPAAAAPAQPAPADPPPTEAPPAQPAPAPGAAPAQPAPAPAPGTTAQEPSATAPKTPPPPAHPVRPPRGARPAAPAAPGAPSGAAPGVPSGAAPSAGAPTSAGAAASAAIAAGEAPREVPQYSVEQILSSVVLSDASFSPDAGKILVTGNQTGVKNAYAISVSDGRAQPVTQSSDDNVEAEGYFPADERVLLSRDRGGNELTHLLVRELDGTLRDLTPGEQVKATFLDWAPDERSFFVSTNERDPRFPDLYEYAVDGYGRRLLFKNETGLDAVAVSPDRRYVALSRFRTATDADVLLYDATTGQVKNLTEHSGAEIASYPQAFTPDGSALLFTTDRDSDFAYLVRHDLTTGERTEVLRPEWDVTSARYSRDGRHLVVSINADGRTDIRLFEAVARGLRPVRLPDLSRADVSSVAFSRDGALMAFYADGSRSPRNLFVLSLGSGAVRQLTRTLNSQVRAEDLVAGQVVRFRSYDGTVIPGIVYKPHAASAERKAPALVWVHGGPGDQSRLTYDPLVQILANRGYVVYAINNRGSSGYGKRFYAMDDRKHGEADLDDCVAAKGMLAGLGYVDPRRIGIVGGSYGGYMVLAALAFRPRDFSAGVDFYGVANWPRTLESIPSWWESIRQALHAELGDPATDAERLRRISPLFHAEKIERPLMVLQGANDPRVLKVESDEIVAAVRKKGIPAEYIVFPDEGHGITKRANQAQAYEAVVRFLDRYVKGPGPA